LEGKSIPLPADGKLLPTATLAVIELPDDWSELKAGDGQLIGITRASSMPKKFPFPDHKGKEQRDRPAYYYRQSSVIPYRFNEGELEILVVRSSKLKHWVVPKGVSDPATSLQDSAAKEAFEEAGVKGEVGEESLGRYAYEKWGAECKVQVYPMEVKEIIPETEWEEKHRGREWLSPKQAMKRLKQTELSPMIEKLVKQLKARS
jgi:phosphohistidine phosphatase